MKNVILRELRQAQNLYDDFRDCAPSEAGSRLLSFPSWYKKRRFGDVITGYRLYDKPLLASYSRSGTNWIRYIVEFCSGLPTPGVQRLNSGYDFVIDRAHMAFPIMSRYERVLLVIRDYKECLVRHHPDYTEKYESAAEFWNDKKLKQPPSWYVDNIKAFDSIKSHKQCVYYEDLIENPRDQIERILDFLSLNNATAATFLTNIEFHKKRSIDIYDQQKGSMTKGNFSRFHANQLSEERRVDLDGMVRTYSPEIFDKYLNRYAEPAL